MACMGAFCNRRVTGITNHSLCAIFLRDESPLLPVLAVTYGQADYGTTKGAMLLHQQAIDIDGLVVGHLNPNRTPLLAAPAHCNEQTSMTFFYKGAHGLLIIAFRITSEG